MADDPIGSKPVEDDGPQQSAGRAAESASNALDVAIDVLEEIQKVVSQGRPTAVRLRFGDKLLARIPVALTAAAAVTAGLAAVLLTKLVIELEHEG